LHLREIALDGNEGDYIKAQKQRNEARPVLLRTPVQPGTLRWCADIVAACLDYRDTSELARAVRRHHRLAITGLDARENQFG
jgi:hypothetical protein